MKKRILIDADGLLYKASVVGTLEIEWEENEKTTIFKLDEAWETFKKYLYRIEAQTDSSDFLFCLSDNSKNYYRKEILPEYKSARVAKPAIYPFVKQRLLNTYTSKCIPRLEADDLLGIMADKGTIQASFDKDIKQVKGKFYDMTHDTIQDITKDEADYWFYYQTLAGDASDGYRGLPKVGDVKARKILADECSWEAVVKAYEAKGLTKEDALIQARVARILRPDEYCFETGEIKLWKGEE